MLTNLQKSILNCIIKNNIVSGKQLSLLCNASVNTVRKNISIINNELLNNELQISAQVAKGYYLEIYNKQKANAFITQFEYENKRFSYLDLSDMSRINYIIRRLLIAEKYVSFTKLCDELFYSKSTINRILQDVKKQLEAYQLTLVTLRNSGLRLEGNEWNKRLCLIQQHKIYIRLTLDEQRAEHHYYSMFMMDSAYHRILRRKVIETMNLNPEFTVSHINMPKVINFIILNLTRKHHATEMIFTQQQLEAAKINYDYAEKLYNNLPSFFKKVSDETDIIALSALITAYRSVTHKSQLPAEQYTQFQTEAMELIEYINHNYIDIDYIFDDVFLDDFTFYLYSLYHRLLFKVSMDCEIITPTKADGFFAMDLCADFAHFYDVKHGVKLCEADILGAYFIFDRALMQNQKDNNRKRFLIHSSYGINYAKVMALKIKELYPHDIKCIDPIEFYDPEKNYFNKYNLLLTDSTEKVSEPYVFINLTKDMRTIPVLDEYFNKILKQKIKDIFHENNYYKTSFSSKEDCYEFIADTSQVDKKNLFIEDLKLRDAYLSCELKNFYAVITTLSHSNTQPKIHLMLNKKKFDWDGKPVKLLIYYSYGNNINDAYTINCFLERLTSGLAGVLKDQIFHMDFNSLMDSL